MNNNQTAFDIDELYFKANNDMAVILNMVRIASLSKKKKGKLLAAIEQKILDTMGGWKLTNHATAVFLYRFFLWLIGVPIFFDFLRIRISQRNSSSDRFL